MKSTRSEASKQTKLLRDESNQITDEENLVSDKKNKITDEKNKIIDEKNKIIIETTINQLNDDCLVNIFTFLPVVDRIRIQRVCKRWQYMSKIPWSDKKCLVLFDKTWSINVPDSFTFYFGKHDRIENGLPGIKSVLKLCGQYVTHIKFNVIQSTTEIYKEIKKRCPNLQSLDHSDVGITHNARIKYVLNNFHSLRHFKLGYCSSKTDVNLINFFKNNTKLESLSLKSSCVLGNCLFFLPKSLVDFSFHQYSTKMYPDLIYSSLSRLSNLNTLSLSFDFKEIKLDVDKVLKALPSNSSIKNLTFINYWRQMIPLESEYWVRLKNLEYLGLKGQWSFNMEIADYCPILSQILLDGVLTSTTALASILAMPNLRTLVIMYISNLTDKHFYEETNVEELEIHCCKNITKQGLVMLSQKAKNLKTLKIFTQDQRPRMWYESMKIREKDDIQKIFKKNVKIYMDEKLLN